MADGGICKEVKNAWVKQVPSCEDRCLCTPGERRQCYRRIFREERYTSQGRIEDLVRSGVSLELAREVCHREAMERARRRVDKIVETNRLRCSLSFELDEQRRVIVVRRQSVISRLLGGVDDLMDVAQISAQEFWGLLENGVISVTLEKFAGSLIIDRKTLVVLKDQFAPFLR